MDVADEIIFKLLEGDVVKADALLRASAPRRPTH
jgi:hypothetical protein